MCFFADLEPIAYNPFKQIYFCTFCTKVCLGLFWGVADKLSFAREICG